jgi:GTP-binding protein LepA
MRDGSMMELHNPADMPDAATIDHIEEPRIKATILVPDEYLGDVLALCHDRRGSSWTSPMPAPARWWSMTCR